MKKHFRFILILLLATIVSCSTSDDTNTNTSETFYRGMDLSFQPELEAYNINYKDANGNAVELLDFVKSKGTNLVRLKLWHTPQNGENGLDDVKAYAQRIRSKNMDFLLNIHYSDYWADPSTQTPPAAWQNMNFSQIKVAIYNYTKEVLEELKAQNTLPKIIQIGNETNSGFLWDYGRVWDNFNDNWTNYASLVSEAIRAVREVDTDNQTQVMLHYAGVEFAHLYFNQLIPFNLDFDIIGLSYYPQFHTKDLNTVSLKLNTLANTFNKAILMVEVAYPFTLQWQDNQTNFIGHLDQTLNEFSPTPQGQKEYLQWLITTLKNIPNNKGIGFCYWAPDWVAFNGNASTSTNGSSWENQCLFDFEHKALPALDILNANN